MDNTVVPYFFDSQCIYVMLVQSMHGIPLGLTMQRGDLLDLYNQAEKMSRTVIQAKN